MTIQELAEKLNWYQYKNETTGDLEEGLSIIDFAKQNRYVIAYWYSDDNVILDGVIDDEVSAFDGTRFYVNEDGLLNNDCSDEDCPYFEKKKNAAAFIDAKFNENGVWEFETDIPHAIFDVMDGEELVCKWIVFCLDKIRSKASIHKALEGILNKYSDAELISFLPRKIREYTLVYGKDLTSPTEVHIIKYYTISQKTTLPLWVKIEWVSEEERQAEVWMKEEYLYIKRFNNIEEIKQQTIDLILWLFDNDYIDSNLEVIPVSWTTTSSIG